MTAPAALWLGGRGDGGRFGGALAYPAMGVLLLTAAAHTVARRAGRRRRRDRALADHRADAHRHPPGDPAALRGGGAGGRLGAVQGRLHQAAPALEVARGGGRRLRPDGPGHGGLARSRAAWSRTRASTRPPSLELRRRAGLAAGVAAGALAHRRPGHRSRPATAGSRATSRIASTRSARRAGAAGGSRTAGLGIGVPRRVLAPGDEACSRTGRPSGSGADAFGLARASRYRKAARGAKHAHGFVAQTLRRPRAGRPGVPCSCCSPRGWPPRHGRSGCAGAGGPRAGVDGERAAVIAPCAVRGRLRAARRSWTGSGSSPGPAIVALVAAGFVAGRGPLEPAARRAVPSRLAG